jgi:hypothetical protein
VLSYIPRAQRRLVAHHLEALTILNLLKHNSTVAWAEQQSGQQPKVPAAVPARIDSIAFVMWSWNVWELLSASIHHCAERVPVVQLDLGLA